MSGSCADQSIAGMIEHQQSVVESGLDFFFFFETECPVALVVNKMNPGADDLQTRGNVRNGTFSPGMKNERVRIRTR